MKWIKSELKESTIKAIAEESNIDPVVASILLNRGMSSEDIYIIKNDLSRAIIEPTLLKNAQLAAQEIQTYLEDRDSAIIIRADYDVDGLTSGKILGQTAFTFGKCYVNISYPERSEGYGLSMAFCDELIVLRDEKGFKRTLLITVDNGITSVDEVEYLKANDIQVIVTDHHLPKESIPNCIVVDPHAEEDSPYKHLAGCGVAFKVSQLIARLYDKEEIMNSFLPYVAMGTIADMMPMSTENIALCIYGLGVINSEDCPRGIEAMKRYIGKKELKFSDIGWEISPRLNSCGRMGNITLGASLFFCDDYDLDDITDNIVLEIERLNEFRKTVKKDLTIRAIEKVDAKDQIKLIVLENETKEAKGNFGVAANEVVKKYNTPAIVISKNEETGIYVGSARSIDGINLQEILKKESDKGLLLSYGGHDGAGGLSLNEEQLAILINSLKEYSFDLKEEEEIFIDGTLRLADLNRTMFEKINFVPYENNSFPVPIFEFLVDVNTEKTTPTAKNKDNLWLVVKDGAIEKKIWAQDLTSKFESLKNKKRIKIAGFMDVNFMDGKSITIKIIDIKEA